MEILDEKTMKQLYPNYVGDNFFINPNSDKDVKATEKLNKFSAYLRNHSFYKFIKNEGFELSMADFKWEYIINFNNKSGFIVMREFDTYIKCWIYNYDNDLDPDICKFIGFESKNYNKIISFIRSSREKLK